MPRPAQGRTADAVREAAIELFYQRGYEATSLREIAAQVGIQVGSLYNHIDGKHDLLRSIMLEVMDELIAAMTSAIAGSTDAVQRLEAALDCHIRFHATHSRAVFIGNSELRSLETADRRVISARRREYEDLLISLVEDVEAAGSGDVVDARLQAYAVLAIGTHVAAWYHEGGSMSLDDIVDTYKEAIRRQLGMMLEVEAAS